MMSQSVLESNVSFDSVAGEIDRILIDKQIPSVSVAVAHHGKILWEQGFGWADRENRRRATEHTLYSLASVSKPLTTTGLMTLVQAGKVDLDRAVNDYLGAAKLRARVGDAREATVRRVVDHTAGLPHHCHLHFVDEPWCRPSMDETILRYGNLLAAPGERFLYSNLGYGILDDVISRVSGLTYPDFMRREVFLRLDMTHSSIGVGRGLEQQQAIRYDAIGNPIPFYEPVQPGAGAAYASAHDLVRFGMFHLKNRLSEQQAILSDASVDEIHRPSVRDKAITYGLGWELKVRPDGYQTVTHGGGMPGVATLLEIVPAENIAVVILLNNGDQVAVSTIRDSIMKTLLPKWMETPLPRYPAPGPSGPMPALAGVWEGIVETYQADLALRLECMQDGSIHVRLGDQPITLLNEVRFEEGWLEGRMSADVHTEDANRHPAYALQLALKRRGDELVGAATVIGGEPRPIMFGHWTRLEKA